MSLTSAEKRRPIRVVKGVENDKASYQGEIKLCLDIVKKHHEQPSHSLSDGRSRHMSDCTDIDDEPGEIFPGVYSDDTHCPQRKSTPAPPLPKRPQPKRPERLGRHNPKILLRKLLPGEEHVFSQGDLDTREVLEKQEIVLYLKTEFQVQQGFDREFVTSCIAIPDRSEFRNCPKYNHSGRLLPSSMSRNGNHEHHRRLIRVGQGHRGRARRSEQSLSIDWYGAADRFIYMSSQSTLECWMGHCVEKWNPRHIPIFPRAICRQAQRQVLPEMIHFFDENKDWFSIKSSLRDDEERFACFLEMAIENKGVHWTACHLDYWTSACSFRKDLAYVRNRFLDIDVVNMTAAIVIDLYNRKDPNTTFQVTLNSAALLFESVIPLETDALRLFQDVSDHLSRPEIYLCLALFECTRVYRQIPTWERKLFDALPWDDVFEKNYFAQHQSEEANLKAFTVGAAAGMLRKRWRNDDTSSVTQALQSMSTKAWGQALSFEEGYMWPRKKREQGERDPGISTVNRNLALNHCTSSKNDMNTKGRWKQIFRRLAPGERKYRRDQSFFEI